MTDSKNFCQLCQREIELLTVHHLIPRQYTKRKKLEIGPTIAICSACHRQVHRLFDHRQLAQELNSLEKLKSHPEMAKFLGWVQKQSPNRRIKIDRPQKALRSSRKSSR